MKRIAAKFSELKAAGEVGLVVFVTVGFPDLESTLALVPALVAAGADIIELGVPFSDPLADGATIQKASFHALKQGVTVGKCLGVVGELRKRGLDTPVALMGYYNPILNLGLDRFCFEAASVGVDGLVVADLPPEEAGSLHKACQREGIDLIFLLAPTSTEERIAKVCQIATGFIYCVSLVGVTGARRELTPNLFHFIGRIRHYTPLPLAVGFGVSTRAHVEAIARYADAVVVGSALIDLIDRSPPQERLPRAEQFVKQLKGKAL